MGCAQLEMLDRYVATKRCIAENYQRGLGEIPGIQRMKEASWAFGTYWLYTILVDAAAYGRDRRSLHEVLKEAGVQTRPLWQPLHRSPAHRRSQSFDCQVADSLFRDALSLPCSVGLTEAQQVAVIDLIRTQALHWPAAALG
jgi:perosamine synthetase